MARKVGAGSVEMTAAIVFSADDGCDVGEDFSLLVDPCELVDLSGIALVNQNTVALSI